MVSSTVRHPDEHAPRPLPRPSWLTEPFWAAAREHRLVRPYCAACAASFFSPQAACPRCLSEDWTYEESSGRGSVYSFTICHRAPQAGFAVPYALAVVDLDEGWSMLSNVDADPLSDIAIGARVEVAWTPLAEGFVLPTFVLAA